MYVLVGLPFLLALVGHLVTKNVWFIPSGILMDLVIIALHTVLLGPAILQRMLGTSDARELN